MQRLACPVQFAVDIRIWVCAGETDECRLHGGRPTPTIPIDFRCRIAILCLHLIDSNLGDDICSALTSVPESDGDGPSAVVRIVLDALEVGLVGVGNGGH